jgi:glutathione S-transferase
VVLEQTDVMPGIGGLRFRLLTGRWAADDPAALQRRDLGLAALDMLEAHLRDRSFFVAERYTIADIALYAYTHTAPDAAYDLDQFPEVGAWIRRVEQQPGFVNDLEPYPENARAGAGRSIYD